MNDRIQRGFVSATKFCAYRERAPKEVVDKLTNWGFSNLETENIISRLKEEKFLDERRFARAFCNDKFQFNHWGRVKIRMELNRFQLPADLIEDALFGISEERYEEIVVALATRKWDQLQTRENDTFKNGQKVARYLMSKGFEGDLVWRIVRSLD